MTDADARKLRRTAVGTRSDGGAQLSPRRYRIVNARLALSTSSRERSQLLHRIGETLCRLLDATGARAFTERSLGGHASSSSLAPRRGSSCSPRHLDLGGSAMRAFRAVLGVGAALCLVTMASSPALATPATELPPSAREDLSARTATSSTYDLADGSKAAVVSAGRVNYRDRGRWRRSDDSLRARGDGGATSVAGPLQVRLPADLAAPVVVSRGERRRRSATRAATRRSRRAGRRTTRARRTAR